MSNKIEWDRLANVLANQPNLVAAWIFGSAQQGQVQPGSDVDVGLLFEAKPTFEEQLALLAKLETVIDFAEIDLVVLNDANPILRFEAISGRPVFCRDLARRAEFASLTAREYEDAIALWQKGLAWQKAQ